MARSPRPSERARIIVVMGVSSSGKSTVGAALAAELGVPFLDGDGYHPPANVEKMRAGIPLTDADRWPWLERLATALKASADTNRVAVGACSALRRSYRDYLTQVAAEPVVFVYLKGSIETIRTRIAHRHHEYMPASLLDSQFATLEEPQADENVLSVDIDQPVTAIVRQVAEVVRAKAEP